ncbi:MAG TPA: Asp-tRNA(Asn)/Glu-tRNA(Gln) amidotransferase subunit GatC [Acidimicrobiales bacterium]|nr:Asp-tRNA(Asn)/Glu-tRNA(Gln) amidotransferase subunit GatC [Acidimicrobiales bacterium]
MTSPLRREDVAKVAKLARLSLSEAELDEFTAQLGQVLEHANDIAALDLEGVVPTAHPFGLINVVREDVRRASLARDDVLAMAPDARDGRFAVPRIMGEAP